MYANYSDLRKHFNRKQTWVQQFVREFKEFADNHPQKLLPVVVAYQGEHKHCRFNWYAIQYYFEWRELIKSKSRNVPTLKQDLPRIKEMLGMKNERL